MRLPEVVVLPDRTEVPYVIVMDTTLQRATVHNARNGQIATRQVHSLFMVMAEPLGKIDIPVETPKTGCDRRTPRQVIHADFTAKLVKQIGRHLVFDGNLACALDTIEKESSPTAELQDI